LFEYGAGARAGAGAGAGEAANSTTLSLRRGMFIVRSSSDPPDDRRRLRVFAWQDMPDARRHDDEKTTPI
jgi:hypothetical protein